MSKPSFAIALIVASGTLAAAEPGTSTRRAEQPQIVSPEVRPDRTVTFRLRAPNAASVIVSGEWPGRAPPMTRDNRGVWTATVGPLPPDLYGYSFSVDGLRTLDSANPAVKPMRSPTTSILHVPAAKPMLHDFQPVPHGTVHLHEYSSKSLGKLRALRVYTPPGYDKTRTRYPVLLFHGSGDNEATWTELGRAHLIVDNLLAQGKAKPMIIVMSDGHALSAQPAGTNSDVRARSLTAFQRDLLEDVMPSVEKNYRIMADREHRAIVGLSMGGGQSLAIGLNHLELFAWVGGMSSAVFDPEAALAGALKDPKATNRNLKLLWFACGTSDRLLGNSQQLDQLLTRNGIKHEFHQTEGNHSWPVWRRYLADFAPRLFVGKKQRPFRL